MKKWFTDSSGILIAIILLFGCKEQSEKSSRVDVLPYYDNASFTPQWLTPDDVPEDFHHIPSFELFDQSGLKITEKNLDQKVTVVDFFFTICPGICPKMTSNMQLVQDEFVHESNLQILSHSVTPEYDSIPVLKKYGELNGIQAEQWHLLTGDRSIIYSLGRNHYFIEEDMGLEKDPDDFIHTENFVLIDQQRRIRGIYNGLNKSSVHQLIADARQLLKQ